MKLYDVYKDLLVTNQLLEALPLSKAKELASIKRNPNIEERLNLIFDKLKNSNKTQVSKRGDRIYIPFNQSEQSNFNYSDEITNYLESNGYKVKDYKTGLCLDKYDRELKIGKVLSKLGNQDLLQKFNTDKGRESKNNVNSFMVFSKHSYDIGGASTDRGWKSCMDLYVGSNKKYILEDVKEGSFIVYLISSNDMNIQKPIARILVKPYVDVSDENNVLYSPTQQVYGTAPDNFLALVNKILENIQHEKVGLFKFVKTLYKDEQGHEEFDKDSINKTGPLDSKDRIERLCKYVFGNITPYSINDNLEIDVDGDVDQDECIKFVVDGKFVGKFGKISGYFYCSNCKLTSLEGSPREVEGAFRCSSNNLKTLEGGPQKVRRYNCRNCKLESLKGAPKEIATAFDCSMNRLKTLEFGPEKVGENFNCENNALRTLDGAPKVLGGYMLLSQNSNLPQEEIEKYNKITGKPNV